MFNSITDRDKATTKFPGFYRGIVIDNVDPDQSGKVKVRVYPMFEGVLDDDLPWAILADANMGGFADQGGINIPLIDSHVFVFFENGDHRFPVYFAGAPSIQNSVPDVPKLSREDDGTVAAINAAKSTSVSTASGGSWVEPDSAYAATYPNNRVFKSKNGVIIEIDDTDANVRFHLYHPSGTRTEIDNAGNEVCHVTGNKTTVIIGDSNNEVQGKFDITVNGNAGIKVTGSATVEAASVSVKSTDIELDADGTPVGVVTTAHIDPFTGSPHPQGSLTVKVGG